jgi:rubrerythrin
MPSFCPHCHNVLEQDEICCAQVRYTWKCKRCHKLSTGFAVPYGKCFLCGGDLEVIGDRDSKEFTRLEVVRDALQFELNSYYFYRLAGERATDPQLRLIFEQLYQNELDHLHLLEERYHAHLDREILSPPAEADEVLAGELFRGVDFSEAAGVRGLYQAAIAMECRTRDHFRKRAEDLPSGLEKDLCLELAAEEEEHVAMLETEMAQFEESG